MQADFDIVILGAGPVGIEAAFLAAETGRRVALVDRGGPAANVRDWGHVRMFSPFGMNSSDRGRAAVGGPDPDALLTGAEFAEDYLVPLHAACEARGVATVTDTVTEVRRAGWPKAAGVGDPARGESPFEVHLACEMLTAAAVLDCTGTYRNHAGTEWRCCEDGAFPVVPARRGDREVLWGPLDPATVRGLAGRRVLVAGSGYTAATDVRALKRAKAKVVWLTRRPADVPVAAVGDDPLPERRRLTDEVNALATSGKVDWRPGHRVTEACCSPAADEWNVTAVDADGEEIAFEAEDAFAAVVQDTGFRPDTALFRELHVHLCYATEGPMALAASLMGETDCLNTSGGDADLLRTPEPNFYVLGAKSYGRNSHFLIRTGIEQVESVLAALRA